MKWVYAILLVLSPAILYGIALIFTAVSMKFYRRRCPTCDERGLKRVNWIRATVLIDGKRVPDSWSYDICEKCGARFKFHHGEWGAVPDNEEHHVIRGLERKRVAVSRP